MATNSSIVLTPSDTAISTTMSSSAGSTTPVSTTAPSSTTAPPDTSSSILQSISSAVSSSIAEPSSTTAPTSNTEVSTSTISISSVPATTAVITSIVTRTPTSAGDTNTAPVTVVITATRPQSTVAITTQIPTSGSSTTSSSPRLNTGSSGSGGGGGGGGGGLSTAGTTAVAVVVPVAVVALLVLAGILFWRKRKQKKSAEEQRRKEIEDYGFNPNNDPTLSTNIGSDNGVQMAEDTSGYRGWGAAGASSRKMSTTLSGGHTQGQLSDAGSNAYGSQPGAPGSASPTGGNSDGHSGDPMIHQRRETMNSEIGSLGGAPVAGTAAAGMGVKRGPSNASSTYSAGNHSDVSDGPPPGNMGMSQSYEGYNPNNGFGYSQHGPYGDGTYGGSAQDDNGMPVVRDVSARRNTRIQQPGNYQQGNSGIAQNF